MSWFTKLFPSPEAAALAMTDFRTPIRSPWTSTDLRRVAISELSGLNPGIVNRSDAMKIPAVVRGRGLICGTLSRHPLGLFALDPTNPEGDGTRLATPAWMTSTKTGQSPATRMLWTLDDLIFGGLSVWATERNDDGKITDALRIPPAYWDVDPDSLGVLVYGKLAKADEVLIFEGPQEGLVTIADTSVMASRNLATAWQQRVESPVPLVELHQTDPAIELDEDEIDEAIEDWEAARRAGGTAFTPPHIEAKIHGDVKADLYVEARNADRIDWANYLGLPAAMLDGSMATASLTYSTAEGKRSEFIDYSLAYWAVPIESRLSQDDVTDDGTFTRFDLRWLTTTTQPAQNPGIED